MTNLSVAEVEKYIPFVDTEIGPLPSDWAATPLPEVIWFQEGPGLRKWQFRADGLKVINVTNLQESGYLDLAKTERHISWDEFNKMYQHFLIKNNDVVMASSGNSYCKTSVVREIDLPLLMNTSVIRYQPKKDFDWGYMLAYLKSYYFKQQIDLMITGGAQPNFGPAHLSKIFIPAPPTPQEQKAIADALSDANALIENLEKLIAKKRQIKQGVMQELLSGERRLLGFAKDWAVKRVGDFTDCTAGGTPATSVAEYWRGHIRWMASGELHLKNVFEVEGRITELGLASSAAKIMPVDCVLIGLAGQGKTRGTVAINRVPLCTNQSIAAILPSKDYIPEYLFYNLEWRYEELRELSAGDGGRGGLNLKLIRSIKLDFPDRDEQQAIVEVLSGIDSEIVRLGTKLNKIRHIKEGMMQELLTGRIRLV